PCRDADGHVGGGIQRRSEEVARNRARSALEAAVYRARLSADARSAALPARERLQDLYRDRRGPGLRARLCREGLRHPARAGGRHCGRNDDATREYAYGPAQGLPDSRVGTFTPALYDEAKKKDWTVISMKNAWRRVFPFEN